MIKIKRADCPEYIKKSSAKAAYRNRKVVDILWNMQNKKCCYCERLIPKEGCEKAVEHFKPKSIFKNQTNEWKNLLLACGQCNGKKSDKFPVELTKDQSETKVIYLKEPSDDSPLLIDPTNKEDDPEKYLSFIIDLKEIDFGLIFPLSDYQNGKETIKVIGLDSEFYTMQHRKKIREMNMLFCMMLTALDQGENDVMDQYKLSFKTQLSSRSERTAVARNFVNFYKIDKNYDINIPKGWEYE